MPLVEPAIQRYYSNSFQAVEQWESLKPIFPSRQTFLLEYAVADESDCSQPAERDSAFRTQTSNHVTLQVV